MYVFQLIGNTVTGGHHGSILFVCPVVAGIEAFVLVLCLSNTHENTVFLEMHKRCTLEKFQGNELWNFLQLTSSLKKFSRL